MHFVDAKGILSADNRMNIYRSFTHPFEDIEVKRNAPALLEQKLRSKRRKCMIGTGAMCDPYLSCEEQLRLTRKCLEMIRQYEYGAAVLTKSDRILRDLDLLCQINERAKAVVQMTQTTYDDKLCRILEPNVCTTSRRIKALQKMQEERIPTIVWLTPILPFINDTEENLKGILEYCVAA